MHGCIVSINSQTCLGVRIKPLNLDETIETFSCTLLSLLLHLHKCLCVLLSLITDLALISSNFVDLLSKCLLSIS